MVESNFRGPLVNMGAMENQAGTTASIEPMDGPSASYQLQALIDPRSYPFAKDGTAPGRVTGLLDNGSFWVVDNKPQAASTTAIAAASIATALSPLALATTGVAGVNSGSPSLAVGVQILPAGTTVVTSVIALDFGFITGTTVANSTTLNVSDNTKLSPGQWIIIGSAGASNQASWITQVQSISSTNLTGATVQPAPPASLANAPIGQGNLYGSGLLPPATQFGPSTASASYHNPNILAGLIKIHNPAEGICRNISISQVTGAVATAAGFIVYGWDQWRMPMTELITVPATTAATTAYGQKAFKYFGSVVPQLSVSTNTYSVGFGDTFGMPLRADEWEQTEIYWAGAAIQNSTGFTVATTVAPTTNTAGDVRGTVQVSANGKGTPITTTTVSNGTSRLAIVQDVGVWNIVAATPINTVPLFGIAQSTT